MVLLDKKHLKSRLLSLCQVLVYLFGSIITPSFILMLMSDMLENKPTSPLEDEIALMSCLLLPLLLLDAVLGSRHKLLIFSSTLTIFPTKNLVKLNYFSN